MRGRQVCAKWTQGEAHMPFSTYRRLGAATLATSSREAIFVRTYMILTWNLMCRSASTGAIQLDHIDWFEDALTIAFYQTKADQEGERTRDARHIYANQSMPEVCCVLALAIYMATFDRSSEGLQLFPGGNQPSRFSKSLHKFLQREDFGADFPVEDLGSHSLRKGAKMKILKTSEKIQRNRDASFWY